MVRCGATGNAAQCSNWVGVGARSCAAQTRSCARPAPRDRHLFARLSVSVFRNASRQVRFVRSRRRRRVFFSMRTAAAALALSRSSRLSSRRRASLPPPSRLVRRWPAGLPLLSPHRSLIRRPSLRGVRSPRAVRWARLGRSVAPCGVLNVALGRPTTPTLAPCRAAATPFALSLALSILLRFALPSHLVFRTWRRNVRRIRRGVHHTPVTTRTRQYLLDRRFARS